MRTAMTVEIGRDIGEFEVGMTHSTTRTITRDDVERFADITGDHNYFHVDDEAARHSIFGRRIAQGLLVASMFTHVGGVVFPGPGYVAFELNTRFLKPVYVGDTLTCTIEITSVDHNKVWLEVASTWTNQKGDVVAEGTSTGRPTKVVFERGPSRLPLVRPLVDADRPWVAAFLEEHWGSGRVVSRGKLYDARDLPGFAALRGDDPVGLVTYHVDGDVCQAVTLNSLEPGKGVGVALMEAVRQQAAGAGCHKLWLITTNDNTHALRFYQKRGFTITAIHRNALDASRKLKPQIPATGLHGIPLRDEIELELLL